MVSIVIPYIVTDSKQIDLLYTGFTISSTNQVFLLWLVVLYYVSNKEACWWKKIWWLMIEDGMVCTDNIEVQLSSVFSSSMVHKHFLNVCIFQIHISYNENELVLFSTKTSGLGGKNNLNIAFEKCIHIRRLPPCLRRVFLLQGRCFCTVKAN